MLTRTTNQQGCLHSNQKKNVVTETSMIVNLAGEALLIADPPQWNFTTIRQNPPNPENRRNLMTDLRTTVFAESSLV